MNQNKSIIIYLDHGVSAFSTKQAKKMLKSFYPEHPIQTINHKKLLKKEALSNCALLVVPGGRDVPYDRALRGTGNQNILDYVKAGGNYLGICAGGYYGASSIIFEKGYPFEVSEERELKFFPGKAIGTLFNPGLFNYENEAGADAVEINFDGRVIQTYYNGGCYFEDTEKYASSVEILSEYVKYNKPAIISCTVGKGKAILSGVHFEYDPKYMTEDQYSQDIKSRIQETDSDRLNLIESLLKNFKL